ncbi:hypothetical protein PMAYCL1PPCAC_23057 [Pristionchus mayeri]|uniref:Uncharacterized protein n=1 Tax=Pristionchus mayeri TaxID=1317129 RepID=A0AAN5CYH2_9BILA|nr:hypothetical protein PMAYCL1PPCAC_23057 [Pristionchus mayeri]
MHSFLPFLLMLMHLLRTSESYRKCKELKTFRLGEKEYSAESEVITFSGRAKCEYYKSEFKFFPDPNAERGRVLEMISYSGEGWMWLVY